METISSFTGEYRFLSNFYMSPLLSSDGITYPSAEHVFQAAKLEDANYRELILAATTPSKAKKLGRTVSLREDWDTYRLVVMRNVIDFKFCSGQALASRLTDTGDANLIEGNSWGDRYWGAVRSRVTGEWVGDNHLGKILMEQRRFLQA